MILYRAMCESEWSKMSNGKRLDWHSSAKWFGTKEFVLERVMGSENFHNSKFAPDRYKILVEFDFDDSTVDKLIKCGYREYMLKRKIAPLVKINSMRRVDDDVSFTSN